MVGKGKKGGHLLHGQPLQVNVFGFQIYFEDEE